jgi:hypothetical protein
MKGGATRFELMFDFDCDTYIRDIKKKVRWNKYELACYTLLVVKI